MEARGNDQPFFARHPTEERHDCFDRYEIAVRVKVLDLQTMRVLDSRDFHATHRVEEKRIKDPVGKVLGLALRKVAADPGLTRVFAPPDTKPTARKRDGAGENDR